jgi:hypothetical protein
MVTRKTSVTISRASEYCLLKDVPDGISLKTPQPPTKKSFGQAVEIVVHIDIDLAKITATAAAVWLVKTAGPFAKSIAGYRNPHIDHASKDDALSVDAVANKIQGDQEED